jgi:hypothetical protein
VFEKEISFRMKWDCGLPIWYEGVDRGDVEQTAEQEEEEHDEGAPGLSSSEAIDEEERQRDRRERDAEGQGEQHACDIVWDELC